MISLAMHLGILVQHNLMEYATLTEIHFVRMETATIVTNVKTFTTIATLVSATDAIGVLVMLFASILHTMLHRKGFLRTVLDHATILKQNVLMHPIISGRMTQPIACVILDSSRLTIFTVWCQ